MMNRWKMRRTSILTIVTLGSLVVLAMLGYLKMNASAAAMQAASQDMSECRKLLEDIAALRELPQFAALEADSPKSMRQRIDQATQSAQLPEASLIRIQPQPPIRLANSEYRLWSTRLELSNVTLRQITTFSHALVDEQRGLTVRDLRLWTNSSDSTAGRQEPWSAEITLTQVTFYPTSRGF